MLVGNNYKTVGGYIFKYIRLPLTVPYFKVDEFYTVPNYK